MTGTIAVIMIFSIPLIAIITSHFQKQSKIKLKLIESQIELEKQRHENYLMETEKMRLELEQIRLDNPLEKTKLL